MCGIFCLLNSKEDEESISTNFYKSQGRGPEKSTLYIDEKNNLFFGFHRLAINGLDKISDQPMTINNITLICNGEIYNYKELLKKMNVSPKSNSDCEVIIHLYEKYGIEQTLQMLDGVFGFALYDYRDETNVKLFIARDPYGVRPLFSLVRKDGLIGYTSLLKNISTYKEDVISLDVKSYSNKHEQLIKRDLYQNHVNDKSIKQFTPGTFSQLRLTTDKNWILESSEIRYSHFGFLKQLEYPDVDFNKNMYLNGIRERLSHAVKKRVSNTDRKIACLLSGGLDSSLITALVNRYHDGVLETYSIGLEGSEDLKYARKVAEFLKTDHTEIIVSEEDFFAAIPEVVKATETWDTTTIRASVGNYLIGKYISEHSEAKVIFNGDGSDELTGGYLYFHKAPDAIDFDKECRRLLKNIHYFDVLRSERCIACHGLEARTPFLDRSWVEYYLSIPESYRCHNLEKNPEKYMLRKAFDNDILLPKEILWRTKEAFSDGVSSLKKSWYEIIDEKVQLETTFKKYICFLNMLSPHPNTLEKQYYRYLFEKYYPGCGNVIPYYWMPNFVDAEDASARSLAIFKELNNV